MSKTTSPDLKIWETRDGRKIPIEQMGDRHLLNTIAMLNRSACIFRLTLLTELAMACTAVSGDGALMAIESEMHTLDICPDDEVLARAVPQYGLLLDEAARRNLGVPVEVA